MSKDKFILHEWQQEKMQDLEKKEEELYYENQMKETFNQGIEQGTEKTKVDIIIEMLKEKLDYKLISKI